MEHRHNISGQYTEAIVLMDEGTRKLIEHKQYSAAGELAMGIVESLIKSGSKPTLAHLGRQIFRFSFSALSLPLPDFFVVILIIEPLIALAETFPAGAEDPALQLLRAALK
jgi:hypothetical protein